MSFDDFRLDLESKFALIAEFELLEYHYEPHSFGSGILAYLIKGRNHKFVFDGRDNKMTWLVSEPHQKYYGADFKEVLRKDGLELTATELKNEIKNSKQHGV